MYLTIYASNEGSTDFMKIGKYDGSNYAGKDPCDYGYVRFHINDEEVCTRHIPKRFYGDIHEKIIECFVEKFGGQQLELF